MTMTKAFWQSSGSILLCLLLSSAGAARCPSKPFLVHSELLKKLKIEILLVRPGDSERYGVIDACFQGGRPDYILGRDADGYAVKVTNTADERARRSHGFIAAGADPAKHIRFRPLDWVCFGATSNFQDLVSTATIGIQCKAGYSNPTLPSCLPPAPAQPVFLLQSTGPAVTGSLYMGAWEIPGSENQWLSRRVIAAADGHSCTILFQNDVVTTKSFLPFVAGDFYNYPFRGFERRTNAEMIEITDGLKTERWLLVDVYGAGQGTLIVPYTPGHTPDPGTIQLY